VLVRLGDLTSTADVVVEDGVVFGEAVGVAPESEAPCQKAQERPVHHHGASGHVEREGEE
jgi:hypothetical protein